MNPENKQNNPNISFVEIIETSPSDVDEMLSKVSGSDETTQDTLLQNISDYITKQNKVPDILFKTLGFIGKRSSELESRSTELLINTLNQTKDKSAIIESLSVKLNRSIDIEKLSVREEYIGILHQIFESYQIVLEDAKEDPNNKLAILKGFPTAFSLIPELEERARHILKKLTADEDQPLSQIAFHKLAFIGKEDEEYKSVLLQSLENIDIEQLTHTDRINYMRDIYYVQDKRFLPIIEKFRLLEDSSLDQWIQQSLRRIKE